MMGFQALGVLALGEIPSVVIRAPDGAGKRTGYPPYLPQPAYREKPKTPFRPVWDKPKVDAAPEVPAPKPPVAQLPPIDIFARNADAKPSHKLKLPTLEEFAVTDPIDIRTRMQEAEDMSDIERLLEALGMALDQGGRKH